MKLFRDDADYKQWRLTVDRYTLGVQIDAFAFEPNHFHFVLKQKEDRAVTKMFSGIQASYAKYFNKKYFRKGTLYEGRFYSNEIKDDKHYQNLIKYIFNNPIKHKLISLGVDGIAGLSMFEKDS